MKRLHPFRGGHIAYQIIGKGTTLVLIHGFLANMDLWRDIVPRLSKRYRLLLLDLPGHGGSSSFGYVHQMEFMGEAIHSILKSHRIRKVFFVGHSLGGYVALAFAESYPDMTKGILLINSTAKADSKKRISSRNQLLKLLVHNGKKAIEKLIPSFFNIQNRKRTYHLQRYFKMAKDCSIQGIIANIEGMKRRKEREIVVKFAPYPIAYLYGKQDSILKTDDLLAESKLNPMSSAKEIDDASHMLPLETAEITLFCIRQFMQKQRLD